MARTASVVIGANFGDEGKGLITDFETRRLDAGVVGRFNGGAQAGHTVTTADGRRHVFGHVSAGTFAGASTYLSSNFLVNPLVLLKELKTLDAEDGSIDLSVSSNARVTTLFDMAINGIAEQARGNNRHGSCGLGINETVTRHEVLPLYVHELVRLSAMKLAERLKSIHKDWVPARLEKLGIQTIAPEFQWIQDKVNYLKMAHELMFASSYMRTDLPKAIESGENVVLEGAQGLMLDEFMGSFPHVTRSITGLPYALVAAKELGLKKVKPIYVTRSYMTRHGAGYFPYAGRDFGGKPVDLTNVDNQWQGSIRFAPLDVQEFKRFVENDLDRAKFVAQALGVEIEAPSIAVTCLDQIENQVSVVDYVYGNSSTGELSMPVEQLPKFLEERFFGRYGLKLSHISRGPTANDVEYLGD